MHSYLLESREIPLDDSFDVIVAGGGPAGCTAAASAAREGSRTLLIEATGALGGMGTMGYVPAWCPFSDEQEVIYKGMAEKVLEDTKAGMPHIKKDAVDWVPIDPERLKRVYDDLVTENGARVLFNTVLSAVDTDGEGRVTTVIVSNKAGLTAYQAKVYVDCTGDADLAAWAGAEFQKGDPDTGGLQPATHCFIIANVDTYAYAHGTGFQISRPGSPAPRMADDDKYPLIVDAHSCNSLIGPGCVGFNTGHIYDVDNTDPFNVSDALILGRRMAAQYRDALAEYLPAAFGSGFLVATAPLMGIRETRRIIGDYVLTLDDYLARRSFDDEICRNSYYLDVHLTLEQRRQYDAGKYEMNERNLRYGPGESHGIPYRCLAPKDLRNVLVAGRSISTDRKVQGSTRVMPVCLAMGEAAGMAASHAAETNGNDVHKVDVRNLRKRLKEEGAYLPDSQG